MPLLTGPDKFFAYARERHAIHLRRAAGEPRPWSQDPIFQTNRFCNIYRELDLTTGWFRKHVRDPLRNRPEVLLATVIFRWFNRISTGEAIFCQPDLGGETAFDQYLATADISHMRRAIVALCGNGPYVTGSYTINTRSAGLGLSKLDGVLKLIEMWVYHNPDWPVHAADMIEAPGKFTLEGFCEAIAGPCLGPFMTYEIACDLRYTALLEKAPDRLTWANLGPGAKRGLNRLSDRPLEASIDNEQALEEMRGLLAQSRDARYWPQGGKATQQLATQAAEWPRWEMREVEHTLCEFDKYERVRLGQGRPRGSFNGR